MWKAQKWFFKDKSFKKSVIENIPLGKVATESDIASAVVLNNAASMMTYQFIDGLDVNKKFNFLYL